MSKSEYDNYRQKVWNTVVSVVGEHDTAKNTGYLDRSTLQSLIDKLASIMDGFYNDTMYYVSDAGLDWGWAKPRFNDYYNFMNGVIGAWRSELAIMPYDVPIQDSVPIAETPIAVEEVAPPVPYYGVEYDTTYGTPIYQTSEQLLSSGQATLDGETVLAGSPDDYPPGYGVNYDTTTGAPIEPVYVPVATPVIDTPVPVSNELTVVHEEGENMDTGILGSVISTIKGVINIFGKSADKTAYDNARAKIWDSFAVLVDTVAQYRQAGKLTRVGLQQYIDAVVDVMRDLKTAHESAISKGLDPDWANPRFHDFYDFMNTEVNKWRAELAALPSNVISDIFGGIFGGGSMAPPTNEASVLPFNLAGGNNLLMLGIFGVIAYSLFKRR